jgi:hypothetical protein
VPRIDIDRLTLHMPTADAGTAERLAAAVAERLAARSLAAGSELGRVDVRVPWSGKADDERLADAVAAAVARAVVRAS